VTELRGRLLVDGRLCPGTLWIADGRIASVDLARIVGTASERPEELPIVAPGLVDLHVHGYGGAGAFEDLAGMARALAVAGTTAFQPTLFPLAPRALGEAAERLHAAARTEDGARVVGLHLEGPFVNPLAAGALPKDGLADPSAEALRAILGPATGDGRGIRTMTLAPELPGSRALVAELLRSGVRVSLGHSRATAREARSVAELSARPGEVGATHLYNAMRGVHHREVGLVGFALTTDDLVAELIGDLVHVGADAIELALRARGPGGLALVSDALSGAGTGCEVFQSHGQTCRVADGAIWIDDPTAEAGRRLTGAAATQLEALRGLVRAGVVSLEDGLRMASETPARALGLENELGRLVRGARADLIVLAPGSLELVEVRLGGEALPTGRSRV